jgi:hypothetical protein
VLQKTNIYHIVLSQIEFYVLGNESTHASPVFPTPGSPTQHRIRVPSSRSNHRSNSGFSRNHFPVPCVRRSATSRWRISGDKGDRKRRSWPRHSAGNETNEYYELFLIEAEHTTGRSTHSRLCNNIDITTGTWEFITRKPDHAYRTYYSLKVLPVIFTLVVLPLQFC